MMECVRCANAKFLIFADTENLIVAHRATPPIVHLPPSFFHYNCITNSFVRILSPLLESTATLPVSVISRVVLS